MVRSDFAWDSGARKSGSEKLPLPLALRRVFKRKPKAMNLPLPVALPA